MRRRKPKPAAIKRAEGNRGKRRLPPVVSSAETLIAAQQMGRRALLMDLDPL